ncbi:MAG: hypothetical protein P4L40_25180 [Terracidiphilus sp.]|nr:hypothetical protein [Terracidiphilus sp.]
MPRKVLAQEPVTLDPQKKLRAGYDVRRPRDERKKTDQPSPHFVENEFFHVVPRSMADGLSGPAPGPDQTHEADQKGFPSVSVCVCVCVCVRACVRACVFACVHAYVRGRDVGISARAHRIHH